MSISGWIFTLSMLLVGAAYLLVERRAKTGMNARFASRVPLQFDEFYNRFYKDSLDRDVVKELLEHVAFELTIPIDKLRPDDRFEIELRPMRGAEFDSGRDHLIVELARMAKKRGIEVEPNNMKTLDDYLRFMAGLYTRPRNSTTQTKVT